MYIYTYIHIYNLYRQITATTRCVSKFYKIKLLSILLNSFEHSYNSYYNII